MKNICYLTCVFLMAHAAKAQMYVSPESYVFVNDQQIFVKQEVNLNGSGAIYLRKEGQLLQGRTNASDNTGTGVLSVFQEGTSNNFGYNYWCAPVGQANATPGNSNFSISQLHRATTVTAATPATILAQGNYDGVATNTSLAIASQWIWKYIAANAYNAGSPNGWTHVGSSGSVAPGLGFTMKGVSGTDNTIAHPVSGALGDGVQNNALNKQRYDFRGKPNDGEILIAVGSVAGANYANNTLTGNPYPSAINLNLFLLENSGYTINYSTGAATFVGGTTKLIDGNAYFWEQKKNANSHYLADYEGGYGVYAPNGTDAFAPGTYTAATFNTYNADGTPNTTGSSSGATYKRMFAPVGQGFMIQGVVSGNAVMKNMYRSFVKEGIVSNSQFERNSNLNANQSSENWEPIQNVAGIAYENYSKLPAPQFKMQTIINNQFTKELAIAFNENSTDGYDVALDAFSNDNFVKDFYFPVATNRKFCITTLPFHADKKIPVTLTADATCSFSVKVSELINFNLADEIYLHDKNTNSYYDIKNGYFDITLDAGTYADRFEVTFQNETLSQDDIAAINNAFAVHQNNEQGILTLFNRENKEITAVALYDMSGKQVLNKVNLGTHATYQFTTAGYSDGIYVVKATTQDNNVVSKKVSIYKK